MKSSTLKKMASAAALLPLIGCNTEADKPNIVFFIVDDMGWTDSSVSFGEEVYPFNMRHLTPNMERLAERGTIMTNAYVCSVSSPTRTTLMTGTDAIHSRITDFTTLHRGRPSDASHKIEKLENDMLIYPDWNFNGISPVEGYDHTFYAKPYPQILRENGYYTIHVGKGHWSAPGIPAANPYNMGFLVNVAGNTAGRPQSYFGEENYGNTKERWSCFATQNLVEYYGSNVFLTEALTREALKTLEYPIEKGLPFYLNMAQHAVHTPISADPRFYQKYRDAGMDEGQARFASMIEGMDKSLGDIMDYLEAKGVADNTIIIFLSDNGGNSENKSKGGILHTQNSPLREGKASCYEGGVRVPMIVCWPKKIAPATRLNTPVMAEDFFPTILSMAGIRNYEVPQPLDGYDLVPLLTKGSKAVANAMSKGLITSQNEANSFVIDASISGIDPERVVVEHFPHQWKPYPLEDIDYMTMLRKGDWKLIYRHRTLKLELYNIVDDIGERNNLVAENPEKVKELAVLMSERLRTWNASMPRIRATGEYVPMPEELVK